jgi:hypothetical protein
MVRVSEYDRPGASDDRETAQTVRIMEEFVIRDAKDPAVIAATAEALADAGISQDADPVHKAVAVFWWLKSNIEYVSTPGINPLVDQTLITPTALLAMPDRRGDCAQFSMLAAAMLDNCGIPSHFKTVAAEPADPSQFSHVYNVAEVYPATLLPFDSSNADAPGAEVAKPFKSKVWKAKRKNMIGNRPTGKGWRNRELRGNLGAVACDETGACMTYDDGTGTDFKSNIYVPPDQSQDNGGGFDWTNVFNGLLKSATTLTSQALSPTGRPTVTNSPNGQMIRPTTTITTPTSNTTVLIALAVGFGFLLLGSRQK